MPISGIPLVVITGPVGSGKSSVAGALSKVLADNNTAHAVIDMDHLRIARPTPPDDPFGEAGGRRNLAAMWPLIVADRAQAVVLADVVEDRNEYLGAFAELLPGVSVTIVRLAVPMALILRRIQAREPPETVAWYLARAPELLAIMQRGPVEDMLVEVGERTPAEVAAEVFERVALGGSPRSGFQLGE
jgi:adenylylsulfate kinase